MCYSILGVELWFSSTWVDVSTHGTWLQHWLCLPHQSFYDMDFVKILTTDSLLDPTAKGWLERFGPVHFLR